MYNFNLPSICDEITQKTDNSNNPNYYRRDKGEIHFEAYLIFL